MNRALLRHTQVYGARWDPPKETELADMLTEPLPTIYQYSTITGDVPVSKCGVHLQDGL